MDLGIVVALGSIALAIALSGTGLALTIRSVFGAPSEDPEPTDPDVLEIGRKAAAMVDLLSGTDDEHDPHTTAITIATTYGRQGSGEMGQLGVRAIELGAWLNELGHAVQAQAAQWNGFGGTNPGDDEETGR